MIKWSVEPKINIDLYSIQDLHKMCQKLNLNLNYIATNETNGNHLNLITANADKTENNYKMRAKASKPTIDSNLGKYDLNDKKWLGMQTNPIIDCIESLDDLRLKAQKLGLKTNIERKKKRKKKKGMIYTLKRKQRVEKPLALPKQYWAESIVNVKLNVNQEIMYLIKWENYHHSDNTWQTIDDLEDCNLLFEDFHKKQFKNGIKINYSYEDLKEFQKCLKETIGENGDIAVLLKLNNKKVKDYDRSSKMIKSLRSNLEPIYNAFTKVRRKKCFDLWPTKIFIQYMVNELKIEQNFGDLRKFFDFVDKRKQVLIDLKEWEQEINDCILESDSNDETIIVENNADLEVPPKLNYISKYRIHKNCSIDSTKVRRIRCECDDNCLRNRSCVCALKIYTDNKRFKSSNVIYECNNDCNCNHLCPNRRVQKGRKTKLIVFKTDNRGWGVMTKDKIPYAAFVMEYVGEIIMSFETQNRDSTYFFNIDEEFCGKCLFVDGKTYGNITRFANHSCSPNMDMHMAVTSHEELVPRIAFFANRVIKPYEELTYDYGRKTLCVDENGDYVSDGCDSSIESDSSDADVNCLKIKRFKLSRKSVNSSIQRIECLCGSEKCKKVI